LRRDHERVATLELRLRGGHGAWLVGQVRGPRNQPVDPTKDRRMNLSYYGVNPSPDGSVWGSVQGMPGALVRLVPGSDPTHTALAEYYEVPWNNPKATVQGFGHSPCEITEPARR